MFTIIAVALSAVLPRHQRTRAVRIMNIVRSLFASFVVALSFQVADAQVKLDELKSDLGRLTRILESGLIVNYELIQTSAESKSREMCRLYTDGVSFRKDCIVRFEGQKTFDSPELSLTIYKSGKTRIGSVRLSGEFEGTEAVFEAMLAKPSPPSRTTLVDGEKFYSPILNLYGHTGRSTYLMDIDKVEDVVAIDGRKIQWTEAGEVINTITVPTEGMIQYSRTVPVNPNASPLIERIVERGQLSTDDYQRYIFTQKRNDFGVLIDEILILSELRGPVSKGVFDFTIEDGSLEIVGGNLREVGKEAVSTDSPEVPWLKLTLGVAAFSALSVLVFAGRKYWRKR